MTRPSTLYVVHCIDTEGPMNETLGATFDRLRSIFGIELDPTPENLRRLQDKEIDLGGAEDAVATAFSPDLLKYNRNWADIDTMLDDALSTSFRLQQPDDFGGGWVYSWHCLDHVGFSENPRGKELGYGAVFARYRQTLRETQSHQDEVNWHFHPLSLTRYPLHAATSYSNTMDVLTQILSRRVLDHGWFPVVHRPGFHSERPDSHAFLEQWIPFDYANQAGTGEEGQPDLSAGRFGDWRRAPLSWRGYHPHHDDHQLVGTCRRRVFRCLNVGTRLRLLTESHVREAFAEAAETGAAVLAFTDHDFRDLRPDIQRVRDFLRTVKGDFPDVRIKYAGAEAAAIALLGLENEPRLELGLRMEADRVIAEVRSGEIFGPQPFLALKTNDGQYFHDNLDVVESGKRWAYVLDEQTMPVEQVQQVGVGSAGRYGGFSVADLRLRGAPG